MPNALINKDDGCRRRSRRVVEDTASRGLVCNRARAPARRQRPERRGVHVGLAAAARRNPARSHEQHVGCEASTGGLPVLATCARAGPLTSKAHPRWPLTADTRLRFRAPP